MSRRFASDRFYITMIALIVMALCGYALPWIVVPSASLTLNGHDLAEWASLVPSQRATSPPLLAPLLLRLQPLALSLLLGGIAVGRRRTAMAAAAICLLAAAQLPPFEFVYDINNLNYRQQFGLAVFSLIGGLCLVPLQARRLALFVAAAHRRCRSSDQRSRAVNGAGDLRRIRTRCRGRRRDLDPWLELCGPDRKRVSRDIELALD